MTGIRDFNNDPHGLNPRQRAFVNAYCELGIAKDAAIKAGYKEQYARAGAARLLNVKPIVKAIAAIKEEEAKHKEKQRLKEQVTFDWAVEQLKHVVDTAKSDDDRKAIIAAVSELNKMYGYQAPAKSINVHTGLNELLEAHKISREELLLKHDKEY